MKVANYPLQTKPYSSVRFSSYSFQFHYIFCWFCYYLLLLPYRFEIIQNACRIRKHALQKILCMTLHFSTLIICTLGLRTIFTGEKIVKSPEKIFKIASKICVWFYIFVFIRLSLFKERNFKEIIATFSWCNGSSKCNNKDKYAAIGLGLLGVFSAIARMICDIFWVYDFQFQKVLQHFAGQIHFMIFLRDTDDPLDEKELTITNKAFAIVFMMLELFLRFSNHFVEVFFYLSCLSVYRLIKDFLNILRSHPNLCVLKISECYDNMKMVLNNMNTVGGSFTVIMFVAGVPFFSGQFCSRMDYGFDLLWMQLDYLQYGVWYLLALMIAAEANHKIQDFKDYLVNMKRNEDNSLHTEKLSILLLEVFTQPIGVKGCGFFSITYGFLGTVFSILVTYVIILLQFQNQMLPNKTHEL